MLLCVVGRWPLFVVCRLVVTVYLLLFVVRSFFWLLIVVVCCWLSWFVVARVMYVLGVFCVLFVGVRSLVVSCLLFVVCCCNLLVDCCFLLAACMMMVLGSWL